MAKTKRTHQAPYAGPRSFWVPIADGDYLLCDPDQDIEHRSLVALGVRGEYGIGKVDTRHPEKTRKIVIGDVSARRGEVARVVAILKPV
jgi:hypothetical protein